MLTEVARAGAEATVEIVRRAAGDGVRPGLVVSLATAGDLLQWHPHLHLLTTDGGFAPDGSFFPPPEWDACRPERGAVRAARKATLGARTTPQPDVSPFPPTDARDSRASPFEPRSGGFYLPPSPPAPAARERESLLVRSACGRCPTC
jgi:hypothetical protein